MAALFLTFLVLASGGAAVGDDGATLPHLQLRGIPDSSLDASDAPLQGPLMDIMSMNGCGSFARLLAATRNASETFEQRIVAGGLTVFCPDDVAVAAFEPKFSNLSADGQLSVLLHHGAATRYGREQIAAFEWMAVRTLAADKASNKSLFLTVGDDGDTMSLWPSPPSSGSGGAAARVTKAISSDDSLLAVYVVNAVLLPSHLRQLLDGGDEACTPCGGGGYLGWLHCSIPVWQGLCIAVSAALSGMVGTLYGFFVRENRRTRRQNEVIRRLAKKISSDDSPLACGLRRRREAAPEQLRQLLDDLRARA